MDNHDLDTHLQRQRSLIGRRDSMSKVRSRFSFENDIGLCENDKVFLFLVDGAVGGVWS